MEKTILCIVLTTLALFSLLRDTILFSHSPHRPPNPVLQHGGETRTQDLGNKDDAVYNVSKLGAKPDGETDSTEFFLKAWAAACGSSQSAQIYVPEGRYLIKKVIFKGPCKNTNITMQIDGTLIAPSDYNVIGHTKSWVSFRSVTGVSIYGGNLDGRGKALWACKLAKNTCPPGATSLRFTDSKDIVINGFKSLNSQMFHLVINRCENVYMRKLMITASGKSPNTDGMHIKNSTGVTVMSSDIKTGDDCISIGPGARNLWIEDIACGPGHGISIGSLAKDFDEEGVQNVTVKSVVFTGTQNGVRIKAWQRHSKGFVEGVVFQKIVMKKVRNPIVIDQYYCPRNENCPNQVSGVQISKITYEDIQGTSASQVAVLFDCSKNTPCSDIKLKNVRLTYRNKPAVSSCVNAGGSVHGVCQPKGCF